MPENYVYPESSGGGGGGNTKSKDMKMTAILEKF